MLIEDTGTVTTPLYIYIYKFAPPALSLNVDSLFKYFRIYVWFRVLYILIVLLLI